MNYELLLVAQAETAVERIINYLAERSNQGAISWCERWEQVLEEVRGRPFQYSLAPESHKYGTEVRQVLFHTRRGRQYRALFTVVGQGIYIIDVRGPGQNLASRNRLRGRK